jgi:hypothetical protein
MQQQQQQQQQQQRKRRQAENAACMLSWGITRRLVLHQGPTQTSAAAWEIP